MASVYDRTDIYDLFDSPKKDAQTLSHWQAVFDGRPIRSALDVSIGTGSLTLALLGKFFGHDRTVYCWTIGFTLIAAVYDLIIALPESVFNAIHGPAIKAFGQQYLPFADLGLGWICPTLIGAAIGLILHFMRGNRAKA